MRRIVAKLKHYHTALGFHGMLAFIWAKMTGTQPLFCATVPGARHPVVVRIGTTDASVLRQVLIECQYDVALPSPPRRIVDAGANIGLAAIFFANKYPEAEIIAIEPEESNFRVLQENARPYPNIYPIQGALWKQDCELSLFDPGSGHHGFQTSDVTSLKSGRIGRVPAFTVETLMERMRWAQVDLLKMDIEGAEEEVLETSDSWVPKVGALMVELHDSIKPGCVAAFERATAAYGGRTTKGESVIAWRSL